MLQRIVARLRQDVDPHDPRHPGPLQLLPHHPVPCTQIEAPQLRERLPAGPDRARSLGIRPGQGPGGERQPGPGVHQDVTEQVDIDGVRREAAELEEAFGELLHGSELAGGQGSWVMGGNRHLM